MPNPDVNCLFCKMVDGTIPVEKIFENEGVISIRDIHPQAKSHFLVIPKTHIASVFHAFEEPAKGRTIVGDLFAAAAVIAREQGLMPEGFRSVLNTNEFGGQTVPHLHLHLLGGEKLKGSFA